MRQRGGLEQAPVAHERDRARVNERIARLQLAAHAHPAERITARRNLLHVISVPLIMILFVLCEYLESVASGQYIDV